MRRSEQVIVSGATGFIGQNLIPLLLSNNYEIIAIAKDENKARTFSWYNEVRFIALDFHKEKFPQISSEATSLIHLAWQGLPNYNSSFHIEENLPKNYAFIESLIDCGVRNILVTGTCLEYGMRSGAIASSALTAPVNPYAIAKDFLRKNLLNLQQQKSFSLKWARLFYMYGKGQNPDSILAKLDATIDTGEPVFNMSGGEQLRDYLSVESVAQKLLELFESNYEGAFNICSGRPVAIKNLVENRIREKASSIKMNLGYYPYPDYEPMNFWGIPDVLHPEILRIPTIPNRPLNSPNDTQYYGHLRLRYNRELDFTENAEFHPELAIYDHNYQNSQAYSHRFHEHMKSVLETIKKFFPSNSSIVEIGCGKGDFIEMVQQDGCFHISGYDATYEGSNPDIHKRYLADTDNLKADLIIIRHVLEHIQKPHEFLNLLRKIFGKASIYIEVPNYEWILNHQAFFDITYEHVNYFSQQSLLNLFDKKPVTTGLCFNEQYQYVIAEIDSLSKSFAEKYDNSAWQNMDFQSLFPSLQDKITAIERSISQTANAYIWGASTKGCMFLVHCRNSRLINSIRFAIDANPGKWDKYLPDSLIPIKSKEIFFKQAKSGDVLIISNPNYHDEIVAELHRNAIIDVNVICL